MSLCNTCSTSGPQPQNCTPTATQVPWDAGSLCTGFNGDGSVADAIQDVANAVCDLSSGSISLPINDSDVKVTGGLSTCIVPVDDLLDSWITAVETYLCALGTTVTELDFTEPIDFDNTSVTLTNAVAYTTLDTITIPANTLNENGEYLELEVFVSTSPAASANSLLKVTFAGVDAAIWNLLGTIDQPYQKTAIGVKMKLTRLTSNTLCVDWTASFKCGKNMPYSDYGIESNITPLDFAVSNNILIQGYKNTGTITMTRSRTTKFCKH